MKTLVLGGVRSGKSRFAEALAATKSEVGYIATAEAGDAEMRTRIEAHRARRPSSWRSHEETLRLASLLAEQARADGCLLVDCLSLWLTNLLLADDTDGMEREIDAFLDFLPQCPGELILVSTESNLGVVPMGELSRRYCDRIGLLHQQVAAHCDCVVLIVAGLPHYLKGAPE